jgi:hypothetical protein
MTKVIKTELPMKAYSSIKTLALQLSIILTVSLQILTPAHALERMGKEGGGGGNVCHLSNGSSILLDLDRRDSEILAERKISGQRIELQKFEKKVGFASVNPLLNNDLRQTVLARLGRISANLQTQKQMIYNALFNNEIMMVGVNKQFNHAVGADFSESQICSEQNTQAVFVYIASILFVSVPTWNELTLGTQADLLIHEGVRHIQKLFGVSLTNRELQTLTWILLRKPNATSADISFVNMRMAEYLGLAAFQKQYCDYAAALSQDSTFPVEMVQEVAQICENPLLADGSSARLMNYASDVSMDFKLPTASQELAREFLEFSSQVQLTLAVKKFSNSTSKFGMAAVHFTIALGNNLLKECKSNVSGDKCQEVTKAYQQILDAGMIW